MVEVGAEEGPEWQEVLVLQAPTTAMLPVVAEVELGVHLVEAEQEPRVVPEAEAVMLKLEVRGRPDKETTEVQEEQVEQAEAVEAVELEQLEEAEALLQEAVEAQEHLPLSQVLQSPTLPVVLAEAGVEAPTEMRQQIPETAALALGLLQVQEELVVMVEAGL